MVKKVNQPDELIQCPVCDVYLKRHEGFICPRCKRGPLCKSHIISGRKECLGCYYEMKTRELRDLKQQELGIKNFLRFMQFLFVVFSILFVALKMKLPEIIDFLDIGIIGDNLIYIGIASVIGYVFFYFIMYNQKNKVKELEDQMKKIEFAKLLKK